MASDHGEIFIYPKEAVRRPNEVLLKLAFNENPTPTLGLIMGYQDIGDETIFTGIDLTQSKMWISKAPLVIGTFLDLQSLQHMVKAFEAVITPRQMFPPEDNIFEGPPSTIIKGPFSADSLENLLRTLGNLHNDQSDESLEHPNKDYFGRPDFHSSKNPKFDFGIDAFLEEFEAKEEPKDQDPDEDPPTDPNPRSDEDPDRPNHDG